MKTSVKTHTFNGRRYTIEFVHYIGGITEVPTNKEESNKWSMSIVIGNKFKHFDNAVHEAMEALGVPDEILHNKDGSSKTTDVARFLWRLGCRIQKEKVCDV